MAETLGDRLQAAFDWAATASEQPPEGGPTAEQLAHAAAALGEAAGAPHDRARAVRLLEPVARAVSDEWPYDDALGLEVLDCLHVARTLAAREGDRSS